MDQVEVEEPPEPPVIVRQHLPYHPATRQDEQTILLSDIPESRLMPLDEKSIRLRNIFLSSIAGMAALLTLMLLFLAFA